MDKTYWAIKYKGQDWDADVRKYINQVDFLSWYTTSSTSPALFDTITKAKQRMNSSFVVGNAKIVKVKLVEVEDD